MLVDELENSLHYAAIGQVLSEFRSSDVQILASSHSPVLVDYIELEDLYLVSLVKGATRISKLDNVDILRQALQKEGLSHSDAWIAGVFSDV